MESLKERARKLSRDFLENGKQYRLGFVEAEQSNPKTKNLGEAFVRNTKEGVNLLIDVDRDLIEVFRQTIFSDEFENFLKDIIFALKNNKRIAGK